MDDERELDGNKGELEDEAVVGDDETDEEDDFATGLDDEEE
ncbi:MAG: hypothetical protein ABA06_02760 [Parcubacteria bacterium C7867-001]|nr:MAG: hypothetical protein ABA06_02760 [Parcubacteria bacterium C7867-001]